MMAPIRLLVLAALTIAASGFVTPAALSNVARRRQQQHSLAPRVAYRSKEMPPLYGIFDGGDGAEKRPSITREGEANQYFASDLEKSSNAEKAKDPLVLIGLFSVLAPFLLLGVFMGTGVIRF